jgi:hypothetical protein
MFGRDWCLEEGDVGDEEGEDNTMLFKVLLVLVLLRRDVNDKLMLLLFICLENDLYLVLTLLTLLLLIIPLNLNGKYCE